MIEYNDMIEMITNGEEFIIWVSNKNYWISQTKDKIILTDIIEEKSSYFSSLEAFLQMATFDGKSMQDIKDLIR